MKILISLAIMLAGCSLKLPPHPPLSIRGIPARNLELCASLVDQELADVAEGLNLTPQQLACARALALRDCGNLLHRFAKAAAEKGSHIIGPEWNHDLYRCDSGDHIQTECKDADTLLDPLVVETSGAVIDGVIERLKAYAMGPMQ